MCFRFYAVGVPLLQNGSCDPGFAEFAEFVVNSARIYA